MLKSCFLVISIVQMRTCLHGLGTRDHIAVFSSMSSGIGYGGWPFQAGYPRIILSCFPKSSLSLSPACPAVPETLWWLGSSTPSPPAQLRRERLKIGCIFVLMAEMMPWECWAYSSDCLFSHRCGTLLLEKEIHVFNFLHYPSDGFFPCLDSLFKKEIALG